MRWSTFAKRRPVALITVLSVGCALFFFRYLNISNYISQSFQASICDIGISHIHYYLVRITIFKIKFIHSHEDYINSAKSALEQDDPCILRIIREKFLFPPSQKKLHLYDPQNRNPSQGQTDVILDVLKDQVIKPVYRYNNE
jgi:hypothetical protein